MVLNTCLLVNTETEDSKGMNKNRESLVNTETEDTKERNKNHESLVNTEMEDTKVRNKNHESLVNTETECTKGRNMNHESLVNTETAFLFDSSTISPGAGGSGITDKHYYDLLDLIMEERRSRRQLEQYVGGPLQGELKHLQNETLSLKTNYQKLVSDNVNLKNKLSRLENKTGTRDELLQFEQKLNDTRDASGRQIQQVKDYVDNISHNYSSIIEGISSNVANMTQHQDDESIMVGLQACGGFMVKHYIVDSYYTEKMKFSNVINSYGFQNTSSLQNDGKFICEKPGLYLFIVTLMSKDSNSRFNIVLHDTAGKYHFLASVQIAPVYKSSSSIDMYHSGTGSAVIQLNTSDTIYIEPKDVRHTYTNMNCMSVMKLK
ncbi:unnamed protein product [Mytilus coruscus]|uniref:C1q domain-containing protein n=1 Tax=Mytilus coruscus TaxID=42192 RepID=A0A6J8EVQ2_MYTCO|nr:unnamed protein product [Mytilus coruscus]